MAVANFVGGCITLIFTCILCSAAGVGGGGINVPILLLIFGYGFDTAVILSLFIVLGNALAQSYLNLGKTHPNFSNLPLIYWELIIILLPAQLGGSNIGSILSKILPTSVLYILAFLVLSFASLMSLRKALHRFRDEKEIDRAKASTDRQIGFQKYLAADDVNDERTSLSEEIRSGSTFLASVTRSMMKFNNQPKGVIYPYRVITVIAIVWICYTLLIVGLARSGKCSDTYAAIICILYVPLTAGTIFGIYHSQNLGDNYRDHTQSMEKPSMEFSNIDRENGIFEVSNDTNNDSLNKKLLAPPKESYNQGTIVRENAIVMAFATVFIGIICSLLGIGGGELLSPLMLSYHIIPQVVSATSASLSFLNTLSLVIRAFVEKDVDIGAAVILFVIGFIGGFIGRKLGLIIAFEYNRASMIIFALVMVLALSALYYVYELGTESFDSALSSLC